MGQGQIVPKLVPTPLSCIFQDPSTESSKKSNLRNHFFWKKKKKRKIKEVFEGKHIRHSSSVDPSVKINFYYILFLSAIHFLTSYVVLEKRCSCDFFKVNIHANKKKKDIFIIIPTILSKSRNICHLTQVAHDNNIVSVKVQKLINNVLILHFFFFFFVFFVQSYCFAFKSSNSSVK